MVLHGFAAADRFRIADAVEQELTRLMAGQGVPGGLATPAAAAHLDAGAFNVALGAKPQALGTQLARSLHQRLSGARQGRRTR
jgi:hypothetical protein